MQGLGSRLRVHNPGRMLVTGVAVASFARAACDDEFHHRAGRLAARGLHIGREGGKYSREFFTEPKAVVMQV